MTNPEAGQPAHRSTLASELGVPLDDDIFQTALTHRSYSYEHGGIAHNERLEFLGDAILGQAVTVRLFQDNPLLVEGELAKRRAALVSAVALAVIARRINLGEYVYLGKGEELTGGRDKESILADTLEAIIGATYVSAGHDAATDLVIRLVEPLLADPDRFGAAMDPKTSLQERAAELGEAPPHYEVEADGPDHSRVFTATVTVGELIQASGQGTSKKHAEMAAAREAWTQLAKVQ